MIKVDISNIWGELSLMDLLSIESELFAAHMKVSADTGAGWMELPQRAPTAEHMRILAAGHQIRETSDVLVVVGDAPACMAAKGGIELLQGANRNLTRSKGDPLILFLDGTLSTRAWNELSRMLEGRDFSLCAISRTGMAPDTALVFRHLRWTLERRYGTAQARRRIYAVTDPEKGALRQLANEERWEVFDLPERVDSVCSMFSPAGLLPMAVAGIDVMAFLRGAAKAAKDYDLRSFENPVWLYTAVRILMERSGKTAELLSCFEPDFAALGNWWRQLMGGEGRDGRGMLPICAQLPGDLSCMGQMLREGPGSIFETLVRFDPPARRVQLWTDLRDLEGINALADKKLDQIQELAYSAAMTAHSDGGCPVVAIDGGSVDVEGLGGLLWFFQLGHALFAAVRGFDPGDLPGVEENQRFFRQELGLEAL